jgi:hypothetical protein
MKTVYKFENQGCGNAKYQKEGGGGIQSKHIIVISANKFKIVNHILAIKIAFSKRRIVHLPTDHRKAQIMKVLNVKAGIEHLRTAWSQEW